MAITTPFHITADEVNCLIHAYFQDSGFVHSAFVLRAEGRLEKSPHYGKHVPRGELIELLSKALLYSEVEAHWKGNAMTSNCKANFSILERHVCSLDPTLTPTLTFRPPPVVEETELPAASGAPEKRKASTPLPADEGRKEKRARTEDVEVRSVTPSTEHQPTESRASVREVSILTSVDNTVQQQSSEQENRSNVAVGMLKGHKSEVFVCAWNPKQKNVLGTGSKDAIVNVWNLHKPKDDELPSSDPPHTLSYLPTSAQADLTSLDWNPEGTLLAAGSYDTYLRVCDTSGQLYFAETLQKGPIFATRFSPTGQFLLTASIDGTVCAWDIPKKALFKQYSCHEQCCLDIEWLSEDMFVSCGVDATLKVMKLSSSTPVETIVAHKDEVNQIKCNPTRTFLASCSDDTTARIWDLSAVKAGQPFNTNAVVLSGHSNTISSIVWCPTNTDASFEILGTSSLDGTSRLWNTSTGDCLRVFSDHIGSIYTMSFSPDARFIATAGADGYLHIYDVKARELRWSWRTDTTQVGIFEIDWQQFGEINRIAMGLESGHVGVVDVSRIPALR